MLAGPIIEGDRKVHNQCKALLRVTHLHILYAIELCGIQCISIIIVTGFWIADHDLTFKKHMPLNYQSLNSHL